MKVMGISGSYRKGGVIDQAIDEILAGARENGAETVKRHLIDTHMEFCTNCRTCTQQEGPRRGECVLFDDMSALLDEIENSDALVLGSPMNYGTITAVMKRFIERLVCFVYWPWGMNGPKPRNTRKHKRAVVVASAAMPALMARLMTRMVGPLKDAAGLLGAKVIGVLFIGLAARDPHPEIEERLKKKARRLGRKLVT